MRRSLEFRQDDDFYHKVPHVSLPQTKKDRFGDAPSRSSDRSDPQTQIQLEMLSLQLDLADISHFCIQTQIREGFESH